MKVTGLIKFIGTIGCCLFLTAHPLALAEQPPGETVVPVEHATFHQLVFADEDIAILNNFYPPNGDSGFHAHYRDLFYVVIQPSQSSGQNLGEPLTAAPMVKAGTATRAHFTSLWLNCAGHTRWEIPPPRAMQLPNTYRLSTIHGCGPGGWYWSRANLLLQLHRAIRVSGLWCAVACLRR